MIPAMNDQPLGINEHIITHELGHTLGLRYTDYYDRSISCVPPYTGVEGDEGVGIIHIPGTPTTAVWDGSVMNACPHIGSTGEFTSADMRGGRTRGRDSLHRRTGLRHHPAGPGQLREHHPQWRHHVLLRQLVGEHLPQLGFSILPLEELAPDMVKAVKVL